MECKYQGCHRRVANKTNWLCSSHYRILKTEGELRPIQENTGSPKKVYDLEDTLAWIDRMKAKAEAGKLRRPARLNSTV